MSDELKIAIEAAKVGAKIGLKYFDKSMEVVFKEDKTPVTIADKESEQAIRKFILKNFPNAKFVGEEEGGSRDEDEFWTIDPIDGTRSFSRGVPGWCVLISLYKNKRFELGVCYFPVYDQMLYAQRGQGAYMNGKRVHVSKIKKLSDAYTTFGNPKYIKNKDAVLRLIDASASVRSYEATYCQFLIAQGKIDAIIEGYGQTWDVGPFGVIIEEAGGKITQLDGSPISLKSRGCISTNGILHDEVVRIYSQK